MAAPRDSLLGQLAALRAGKTTSKELTERSLKRVEKSRDTLNAFKLVVTDDARQAAAAADEARARGEDRPLLGIPVAIKDDTDLAGHPTAFGCVGDFPPKTEDAEVVRRLKEAGAVVVGKTTTCELGQWPVTGSEDRGYTRNPWSRDHTPGGSSGGTAAAVAGGLVAAGLGSDGAGSIRIPSAWTNLVGIKPQRGRLSTHPWPDSFYGLTVNGPIARTVADAAYLFDATQGQHPDDQNQPGTVPVFEAASTEPERLRIALAEKSPLIPVRPTLHPEIRAAHQQMGATLVRLGHEVERREPLLLPVHGLPFLAYSLTSLDDWRRALGEETELDLRTVGHTRTGRLLRRTVPLARAVERVLALAAGRTFASGIDVIVMPTTAQPPLEVGLLDRTGGWETDRIVMRACPYTWAWNVLGWPAVNVPAGFTEDGLPIGVQLLGPANSEPLLVSLAAQLEHELGWHRRRPTPWW